MVTKKDKSWILQYIHENSERPLKARELAKAIGISSDQYPSFRKSIKELIQSGQLVRLKRGRIGLPEQMNLVTGTIQITRAGYGFLKKDGSEDEVFIAARNLFTAFDKDRVTVRMKTGQDFRGKPEGKIIDIIERKTTRFVGTFRKGRGYNIVVPAARNIHRDIDIIQGGANRARDGETVVVELQEWTDPNLHPEGVVVERLGMPGDPRVDMLAIIHRFELPGEFPEEVLREAHDVAADWSEEIKKRPDLTQLKCFTIDPADAKDHDDAISLERVNGNYRLGVHIADVSHFVVSGTKLDKEAFERGTSVYFPDRVIPMLPEELSNDACSLRQNQKRLAFSLLMDLNPDGDVIDYKLFPSVIKSYGKLSYDEVQELFDGKKPSPKIARLVEPLNEMRKLARILLDRRSSAGSLDFDLPEAKITLDKEGRVVEIGNRIRLEAHRLVEEFMLAANRQVALHFTRLALPTLYRVHDKPDMEKLEAFAHVVAGLGYKFPVSPNMPTLDFANFIEKMKGKPEEELINELLLRSLKKAVYQPENVGHFGLAFKHYLHFTSPIRRYPDLLVHRLLKQIKNGHYPVKLRQKLPVLLTNAGQKSSDMERRAMEAEREAVKAKQVEYMAEHVGEEYDGIISGVIGFGFFVRLEGPGAEGLVKVSSLDDDYYRFDETGYRLIGRRRGRVFRLGDRVRVGVERVGVEEKEVDLFLIQAYGEKVRTGKKKNSKKRKK